MGRTVIMSRSRAVCQRSGQQRGLSPRIAGQPDQIQADAGQKTATPDAAFTTKVCIEKITLSSRRPVLSWP